MAASLPWLAALKMTGVKVVACSHAACSRWLTQRHLETRRVGVTMHARWYCSFGCMEGAAVEKFTSLLAPVSVSGSRAERMPLGQWMIGRGLLTHDQLRAASDEQRVSGEELGETLVRLSFATEKQVTAARAMQWGCPVFAAPARGAVLQIHLPPTLMRLHTMAPLHCVGATRSLLVGFVHGIEYGALYAVEQVTGWRTQPCFVGPSDFALQMQRMELTENLPAEELTFDSVQSAARMARILCDYGVLLNANDALMGRAGDFVWARLKSGSKATDILMKAA